MSRTLSLDVSAASTGWCILSEDIYEYGIITTSPKQNRSERLLTFRDEMLILIDKVEPDNIVLEDVFSGLNVKTLKILAEWAGVTKEVCQYTCGIDPYVISTNTVKAYFKVKKKEGMFDFIVDLLEQNWTFKKDNDIVDAIGQAVCYRDLILEESVYRHEFDYGYKYIGELP